MGGGGRLETGIPARLNASEGRRFAFTVGAAFLVLAGVLWWRGHSAPAAVFALVGGTLGVAGAVLPSRLTRVHRWWMAFALAISKVTTPVFMGIVFFLVMLPTGLLMRIFVRNPVERQETGDGFWVERPEGPRRRSDLRRQF